VEFSDLIGRIDNLSKKSLGFVALAFLFWFFLFTISLQSSIDGMDYFRYGAAVQVENRQIDQTNKKQTTKKKQKKQKKKTKKKHGVASVQVRSRWCIRGGYSDNFKFIYSGAIIEIQFQ